MTPHQAEFIFEIANWALVAALLVGVIATHFIFITTRIKEADAQEKTRLATEYAANAVRDASNANERAATLELKAAEIEKANLELQTKLEKERIQRLKLEERIAPRKISETQFLILRNALLSIPKPAAIAVHTYGGDESDRYGESLCQCINAGQITPYLTTHGGDTNAAPGMHIKTDNDAQGVRFLQAIVSVGIPHTHSVEKPDDVIAFITIGPKPI